MRFGEIFDKINPYCEGYLVIYLDDEGKLVEDFYIDERGLEKYREWCLQGISCYDREGYGACLRFSISKRFF